MASRMATVPLDASSASATRRLASLAQQLRPPQHAALRTLSPSPTATAADAAAADDDDDDDGTLPASSVAEFERQGFLVIPNAVPRELCERVAAEMFAHAGMDRADSASWHSYRCAGVTRMLTEADGSNTMLNMWHTQGMWDLRTSPRIHRAMSQLWGTEELWCSIDTCDLKPPASPQFPGWGAALGLHCDLPPEFLRAPGGAHRNRRIQGQVYLADTSELGGGFRCIPGFVPPHFDEWVASQPAGAPLDFSRVPEQMPEFQVQSVAAKQGDLLVWNSYLPHGNGDNYEPTCRLCQYVTMFPAAHEGGSAVPINGYRTALDDEAERQRRIRMWREALPQGSYTWPPLPADDPRSSPSVRPPSAAALSPLGRKLLGLDAW
jgi:hypothetical protein